MIESSERLGRTYTFEDIPRCDMPREIARQYNLQKMIWVENPDYLESARTTNTLARDWSHWKSILDNWKENRRVVGPGHIEYDLRSGETLAFYRSGPPLKPWQDPKYQSKKPAMVLVNALDLPEGWWSRCDADGTFKAIRTAKQTIRLLIQSERAFGVADPVRLKHADDLGRRFTPCGKWYVTGKSGSYRIHRSGGADA